MIQFKLFLNDLTLQFLSTCGSCFVILHKHFKCHVAGGILNGVTTKHVTWQQA